MTMAFILAGYSPVTYAALLLYRSAEDATLDASEDVNAVYLISSSSSGLKRIATIDKTPCDDEAAEALRAANLTHFRAQVEPFCNAPIFSQEVRFETHDWTNKSDWDGRTHGDQVAYLAGGVMKHPIDGSWLDATGAAMIAAYGGYPDATHTGDPNYLFGAYAYRITSKYDDVNYKWTSADGTTRYAWLDLSVSPPVWKNDAGTTVVHYDTGTSQWIRNDNSAVVTSSRWVILPYPGHKIKINQIKSRFDTTAVFTGALHYQVYMDLAANVAGAGYPAGNYKVADWKYADVDELAAGADKDPYIGNVTKAGHSGPGMILSYDYIIATKPPVVDSMLHMHLDILLSDDAPVTSSLGASATFVCLNLTSFG